MVIISFFDLESYQLKHLGLPQLVFRFFYAVLFFYCIHFNTGASI
jgi:hypothetical protein